MAWTDPLTFDSKAPFCTCVLSPLSDRAFSFLCPCHDCSHELRDKLAVYTVFVDLPCVRGQWRPGGDTPHPRSGAAGRSHQAPEARGSDPEDPPRARGQGRRPEGAPRGAAVAVQAQEGLEELSHVEGQEWWR